LIRQKPQKPLPKHFHPKPICTKLHLPPKPPIPTPNPKAYQEEKIAKTRPRSQKLILIAKIEHGKTIITSEDLQQSSLFIESIKHLCHSHQPPSPSRPPPSSNPDTSRSHQQGQGTYRKP
jgi:hypothetical protein